MDRAIVYNGEELIETDILNGNKFALIGLSQLAQAVIGAGPALVALPATPGGAMNVSIGAGQVYQTAAVDSTAYSSLGADARTMLKQGLVLAATVLATPAPAVTPGTSIAYLIQFQYQDVDAGSVVLPFYNATNPAIPYSGPAGAGTPSYTTRLGVCAMQVKAGAAATTGTQVTPTPDAGWIGGWVVTVAYGQAVVIQSNIAVYSGAPFLTSSLTSLPLGMRYVNSARAVSTGSPYLVDSSAGSFNLTLPGAPTLGDGIEFIDARSTWGTNTVTLLRNGQTIMAAAQDLVLNVSDQRFTIWFNGSDWRLL
ncbi:MAG: Phage-related tail fiber protein [Polaromonas sp.]|nr:Phage-related tail fiber protein [Polaromonas sp.]